MSDQTIVRQAVEAVSAEADYRCHYVYEQAEQATEEADTTQEADQLLIDALGARPPPDSRGFMFQHDRQF